MARAINDELRQMLKEEADEMIQEGTIDPGFNQLRNDLYNALKGRCNVSNLQSGMLGSKFAIKTINEENDITVTVDCIKNGCAVKGKTTNGGFLFWRNVSLSKAFERIMSIFESPKEVFGESANMTLLGRFFQEAGDDDSDEDEGESLEDIEKDMDSMDSDDNDDNDDDSNDESDDSDDGDEELGKDNSDVQNEYDEEELTILNKLIADEQEAIQGYFDAAEKSKQDVLVRLYSDIGKEERFHTEQLLYAKAELTGEKYEPSDPEVKKEYEELLENGMDEETAMYTIADKHKLDAEDNEELDEDLEDIEKDIESLEESFYQTTANLNLLMEIQESAAYKNHADLRNAYCEFAETVFVQEAMDNVATTQGSEILGTNNPFLIIGRAIKAIYTAILSLVRKIKNWINKRRIKAKRVAAWIKKHGIKGLFADGVKLYFWNDQTNQVEVSDAVAYLTLLINSTTMVAKKLGIKEPNFKIKGDVRNWMPSGKGKVPVITSPKDAIGKISGVVFSKSKLIVNDSNSEEIERMFFGMSNNKIIKTTTDDNNNTTVSSKEINIYNALNAILELAADCSKSTDEWMNSVQNAITSPGNNAASKNPAMFKECVDLMKEVSKGYQRLVKVISADLSTCMKLDNGLLAAVQAGEKGRSDRATDIRNGNTPPAEGYSQYGDGAYNIDAAGNQVGKMAGKLH